MAKKKKSRKEKKTKPRVNQRESCKSRHKKLSTSSLSLARHLFSLSLPLSNLASPLLSSSHHSFIPRRKLPLQPPPFLFSVHSFPPLYFCLDTTVFYQFPFVFFSLSHLPFLLSVSSFLLFALFSFILLLHSASWSLNFHISLHPSLAQTSSII